MALTIYFVTICVILDPKFIFSYTMEDLSRESQIHAFLDGFSTRLFLLSNKDNEIPKGNYRPTYDEVDPRMLFLVANPDGDEEKRVQPSFDSMSRITRDNNIPFSPEMIMKGITKRVETQNRETRGNNIYLRAGKRALYPPIMASTASNLGPYLGPYSEIRCLKGDTSSENDNRCIWSNGRFKNVNLLSLKGNSNGSSRWKWAPDLAIFNRDNWFK